jgi:hypothetical protein
LKKTATVYNFYCDICKGKKAEEDLTPVKIKIGDKPQRKLDACGQCVADLESKLDAPIPALTPADAAPEENKNTEVK